jgi:hypothetical protein
MVSVYGGWSYNSKWYKISKLGKIHFSLEYVNIINVHIQTGARGSAVGWGTALQVGKVAGSIPDGVIGNFQLHNPSGHTYSPGVDSASNRNEYQEYFLGVKAAGA